MASWRHLTIALGLAALAGLPRQAVADVTVLSTNFSSFALAGNWEAAVGSLGAPNVELASTGSGLRMVTAQSPNSFHGIAYTPLISMTTGTVRVDFTIGAQVDNALTLPNGTNRENIDDMLVVDLYNPTTGALIWSHPTGGCYATCTNFAAGTASEITFISSGGITYGASYSFVYALGLTSTTLQILNSTGSVLYTTVIDEGTQQLGAFQFQLNQQVANSDGAYYNDVTVNDVDITAAPEAPAWAMLAGGLAAVPVLRRWRAG